MNPKELLTNFGLSNKEAKTYLAALELGNSTVKPIADKAGLKRTSIYNFIDHLIEIGLITKSTIKKTTYYQAVSPHKLLEIQKQRLDELEDKIPGLMGLFNTSGTKPRIQYYEGPGQVKNIMLNETECSKEALYIWPGKDVTEMIGGIRYLAKIDAERIAKKIMVRAIRFDDKDKIWPTSSQNSEYYRQLRFAPRSFKTTMGLAIYDTRKVCFISSEREGFGIVIESKEIENLARSLFELLWQQSRKAEQGEG